MSTNLEEDKRMDPFGNIKVTYNVGMQGNNSKIIILYTYEERQIKI